MTSSQNLICGIDVGTNTGIATWNTQEKRFNRIESLPIHKAMNYVEMNLASIKHIYIEKPGTAYASAINARARIQGAGSVKRDYKIWADFLTDLKVPFTPVAPNRKGKMNAESFKRLTGWAARTNEHARDAAVMVFQRNN